MICNVYALLSQVAAEYERVQMQNEFLLKTCLADANGRLKSIHETTSTDDSTNASCSELSLATLESPPAFIQAGMRPVWDPELFKHDVGHESAPETLRSAPNVQIMKPLDRDAEVSCAQHGRTSSSCTSSLEEQAASFTHAVSDYRLESDLDCAENVVVQCCSQGRADYEKDIGIDMKSSTTKTGAHQVVTVTTECTSDLTQQSEHAKLHQIWKNAQPRHQLHKIKNGSNLSAMSHQSGTSRVSDRSGGASYQVTLKRMQSAQSRVARAMSSDRERSGDAVMSNSFLQYFVLRPNSVARIVWDLASALMILFDVCVIPLQVFDIKAPTIEFLSDIYTTIFWTCDLLASFFVGYHHNGFVEMRPRRIAVTYLKGWFIVDFVIISIDWFLLLSPFAPAKIFSLLRIAKVVRVIRVLRAIRLFRLVKAVLQVTSLCDTFIISDAVSATLSVAQLICFVIVSAHFIACGWFAIGKLNIPEAEGESWLLFHMKKSVQDDEAELNVLYLYTTAMHWALTQFTPASMEVTPRNWFERMYAIFVLLFGLLVFSSILSRITASTSRLRDIKAKDTQNMDKLHKYITQHKTTLELNGCIFSYLKYHRKQQRQRLHMPDVDYLSLLPESLRVELCVEVFAPALLAHPLFYAVAQVDESCLTSICKSSISELFVGRDEYLFSKGDAAAHMWYLTHGALKYDRGNWQSTFGKNLRQGTFVSEISLWVNWKFEGNVSAKKSCEVLMFQAAGFHKAAQNSGAHVELRMYAQIFLDSMKRANTATFEVLFDIDKCCEAVREVFEYCGRSQPIAQPSSMYRGIKQIQSALKRWLTADSDESVV